MGCLLCSCFNGGVKEESPEEGSEQCGADDIKSGTKCESTSVPKTAKLGEPISDGEKKMVVSEEAVRKEHSNELVSLKFQ